MSAAQEQDELLARAGLYSFFSGVLLREFDRNTLESIGQAEWKSALECLEIECPGSDDHLIEELAVDYCRIFVGPQGACVPCQSVWEDGQYQSRVIESMSEFLDVVTPEGECAIRDHAGLQFEMMARMLCFEASRPNESYGLSEEFFKKHIAWTERMFGKAANIATTDFYRDLLEAGKQFVQSEMLFHGEHEVAPS